MMIYFQEIEPITEAEKNALHSCCAPERLTELHKYKKEDVYITELLSGVLLQRMKRDILAECPELSDSDLCIVREEHGKPVFSGCEKYVFNMTHTKGVIALAFGSSPEVGRYLGLDAEYMRKMKHSLENRFFTGQECSYIHESEEKEIQRFFEIWTRKEAVLKAIGTGLTYPLNGFDVSAEDCTCVDGKQIYFTDLQGDAFHTKDVAVCLATEHKIEKKQICIHQLTVSDLLNN